MINDSYVTVWVKTNKIWNVHALYKTWKLFKYSKYDTNDLRIKRSEEQSLKQSYRGAHKNKRFWFLMSIKDCLYGKVNSCRSTIKGMHRCVDWQMPWQNTGSQHLIPTQQGGWSLKIQSCYETQS